METGYTFGFRSEEVAELRVRQIDRVKKCVRLDETTNDESRVAYMTADLIAALLPLLEGKGPDDRVFTGKTAPS